MVCECKASQRTPTSDAVHTCAGIMIENVRFVYWLGDRLKTVLRLSQITSSVLYVSSRSP